MKEFCQMIIAGILFAKQAVDHLYEKQAWKPASPLERWKANKDFGTIKPNVNLVTPEAVQKVIKSPSFSVTSNVSKSNY